MRIAAAEEQQAKKQIQTGSEGTAGSLGHLLHCGSPYAHAWRWNIGV